MKKRYYPLQELLDRVNQQLNKYPDLDQSRFTKRTIYYYVQEGLLERPEGIRRGPRAPYPAEFVDLLLFIRRLQSEEALTLEHIRNRLLKTSHETICQVAAGEERFNAATVDEIPVASQAHEKEQTSFSEYAPQPKVKKLAKPTVSKQPAIESTELFAAESDSDAVEMPVEIYQAGGQAKLEVEGEISARQRRQLIQATNLIQTILEDTEEDSED